MRTCLIGLVDAGKSTALAALWFSVTERSNLCNWYLANTDRPKDAARWIDLRDHWLSGERVKRTEHETAPGVLRLKLTENGGDQKLDIAVPDIAGEDFEKLFEVGKFPTKHGEIIQKSDHIVLFVHATNYDHPVKLKAPKTHGKPSEKQIEIPKWQPEDMYPGSKIVAMMRGVMALRGGGDTNISVVLSAWDLIENDLTPETVLKENFPLLHQYLSTNFDFELFGLSAQGGDYENGNSFKDIEFDDIERISVVGKSTHNDITRIFG